MRIYSRSGICVSFAEVTLATKRFHGDRDSTRLSLAFRRRLKEWSSDKGDISPKGKVG